MNRKSFLKRIAGVAAVFGGTAIASPVSAAVTDNSLGAQILNELKDIKDLLSGGGSGGGSHGSLAIKELIFGYYGSGYRATVWNSDGKWSNSSGTADYADLNNHMQSIENPTGSYWTSATAKQTGFFYIAGGGNGGNPVGTFGYYVAGDNLPIQGTMWGALVVYFGEDNPLS